MTGDEIRSAYLNFFKERGHDIIPSDSLIPRGDPTLLFTSAGMVQFQPYYLGEKQPANPRLASCQKCFRTTDIESVGDLIHLTFFEMLGNFSIGDYFKQEAISWAWEFVTRDLGLPPSRLWIGIFLDDDETLGYWRKLGVPEARILRFGEEDNFWGPPGNSGPCGPCSEIHYDLGENIGCGKPSCSPACGCGRFSEIWNLVFTQYNQDETGRRTLLPKPNIDTGMGLERVAAIMQGKASVYETDLFMPLLECVSGLAEKKYGSDEETDNAMRVVVEHGRAVAFLIGDGVIPANEGRGYVLRRLLRRAAVFSRRLAKDKPFLAEVAKASIRKMSHIYPEIVQREDFIIRVIESEEARFSETLSTGLGLLDEIIEEAIGKGIKVIPGKQAFKLYDTYGFPIELTKEVASRSGLSMDLTGFEREMAKQREKARAAHKFARNLNIPGKMDKRHEVRKTTFVGYDGLKHKSPVAYLMVDDRPVETVAEGKEASVVLEASPFYGEMGGQVGDTGELIGTAGRFSVTDTTRSLQNAIVHHGYVSDGSIAVGDIVEAIVDGQRRLDIARNHTATHLLQLALRQVLGEHVQQRGSLVTPERLRFDFSHLAALAREELNRASHIVNDKIRQNLKVYSAEVSYSKAIAEGVIALFDEKYGDIVRVVKIGEAAVSAELCGGTHVGSTGEIGFFQIVSEGSVGAGLRRIEAVTGREAEEFVNRRFFSLDRIADSLGTTAGEVQDRVALLSVELETERRRVLTLERELSRQLSVSLLSQVAVINGVNVLAARVPSCRLEALRELSDRLREELKSVVIVLGTICDDNPLFLAAVTPDLVAKGYNAGEIVRKVAKVTGGGGGGKAQFAQAGGKDKSRLEEALHLAKSLV
ncbi:MAG: alanine--tRNA ligase [Dehalococcoidales bacterium]|nr:alanine--tRNA ligase [Dehalococcoidales bacterium]